MQDYNSETKQQLISKADSSKKSVMENRLDDRINKLIALHVKVLVAAEQSDERNRIS